ncbi:MAG: cytosolic protein [Acidobacteriia bacterium]|nr:cytosolic protein [Terriglobia bacterium]
MTTASVTQTAAAASTAAWESIRGAYDLQVHVAPDIIARRIDDLGLAQEFLSRGLKGFVLKSHYMSTAERAKVVSAAVPGIAAYGAITLNHSVGGLNPVAVDIAGRSGAKIVWFPTVDAENETAGLPTGGNKKLPFWAEIQREISAMGISPPRMTVLDENGKISSATRSCIELIAKHDMILATGHLGRHEIFPLVRTAREMKVRKVLVTHAEFPSQNLTAEEQVELANTGAMIEHCFTTMHTGKAPWPTVMDSIRAVGPERCLLSTDLGQTINPPVAEGFALFAQTLLDGGFTVEQVRCMAVTNSAALVE